VSTLCTGKESFRVAWRNRSERHQAQLGTLVRKELHTRAPMNSSTPVSPEERSISNHEWMQEDAHLAWLRGVLAIPLAHCLTGNLALSASNPSFPPLLHWSVLQGRNVAHLLWSGRSTWHSLERKRKMFHEANRREESVASAHGSPAARFQRRGAWNSL